MAFAEAHARIRASHGLRAGWSMTGEKLAPNHPHLAAAVASGRVAWSQTDTALRCLQTIEKLPWTTPADVVRADEVLAEPIVVFDPTEYQQVTHRAHQAATRSRR